MQAGQTGLIIYFKDKEDMIVKVDLKYFSGTGNSYKVLDTCRDVFIQNGCRTTLSSVTKQSETGKSDIDKSADLIGFCFPVYAFDIPRICKTYLSNLPGFERKIRAFVLITAGDSKEAGFSVRESARILTRKGLDVTYTKVIQMPANWTVLMNPPSQKEALSIIKTGIISAKQAARDILNGVVHHHRFNYPPTYSKAGFYKDYYLFKWLGLSNYWREFRTDETCDSCGLCEKLCPTDSIRMVSGKPNWSKTCEQCMRCVNYCPNQAIFLKSGGSIKGKNTYHEPTFRPNTS